MLLGALPLAALGAGLAVIGWAIRDSASLTDAIVPALVWTPVATLVALVVYAALTVIGVRVLSLWLREGYHPVRSRVGWQIWATERLMDAARNYLFPLYASLLTPTWLRVLGREGRPRHRDLHGVADAEVHRHRGQRIPGGRHHGGVLRARRRLDSRRQGRRSESGRSWATPASRSLGGRCPTTGWSRCCPRRRARRRRGRRGSAAHRCGCAASRPRPTRCARSTRRYA